MTTPASRWRRRVVAGVERVEFDVANIETHGAPVPGANIITDKLSDAPTDGVAIAVTVLFADRLADADSNVATVTASITGTELAAIACADEYSDFGALALALWTTVHGTYG